MLERIEYGDLTAKQKEAYNFAQVSAILAQYGFLCNRVIDDDKGPDFFAFHAQRNEVLFVQQKSALSVHQAYEGKNLWMVFHVDQVWYLIEHDRLRDIVANLTNWLNTTTAKREKRIFRHHPPVRVMKALEPYRLNYSPLSDCVRTHSTSP